MYKTRNSKSMEKRITDREQATNSTFGYLNERGIFEATDLKQHLIDLGIYTETDTREMSNDLKAYYTNLKQIVNSL